ncbi:MAG TPA: BMP family ABC transporter substrate-binding protein, partial [Tissierellia bacterium]|nr:BMP family ABC transporter substrate-binding protein [Tissierellia bacterium]
LMQRTDALYIITDNLIASSVELVIQKANEKGVVTLGSERGMVETGLLLTHSIDYKELGRQTARMAERILIQGADVASMPVEYLENTQLIINKKTMETLQIEIPQDILAEAELVERTE